MLKQRIKYSIDVGFTYYLEGYASVWRWSSKKSVEKKIKTFFCEKNGFKESEVKSIKITKIQ